jgi:predicted lipid-binding transport protein (Tim44 family)
MRLSRIGLVALSAAVLLLSTGAEARRMGGGGNFGAQRQSVTPQRQTPAQPAQNASPQGAQQPSPAAPGNGAAPAAAPANAAKAPAPTAPQPSGMSRLLGPIAGIAAGLGLAALLSHFGLSEGFASLLLIALVIFAAVAVLRMLLARRAPAPSAPNYSGNTVSVPWPERTPAGASATPSWRIRSREELDGVAAPPAVPVPDSAPAVTRHALPEGFDSEGFAREARKQYAAIQRAWDRGDRAELSRVMTAPMASEMGRELDARGPHQATEIVALDAEVLEVTTEGSQHWASVRFTGQVREDGDPLAHAIDEVWNLSKPVDGSSGWLLAGISQLA